MRVWQLAISLVLFATSAPAVELPGDVFVRDALIGNKRGIDRLVLNVELGRAGAERSLEQWLPAHPGAATDDRLQGYSLLCDTYFREQRLAEDVRVCTAAERIKPGSTENMPEIARAFARTGAATWSSLSVIIPLNHGQTTLVRANGATVEALFDTGANVAVISRSTARLLGAQPIAGKAPLGTTTSDVTGGLVSIGSITVGN